MYLLPLLFSNLHLGLDAPFDGLNPTVGRTSFVRPEDLVSRVLDRYYPVSFDRGVLDFYYRPWLKELKEHIIGTTTIDDDSFKITLNVQHYKPEEITVKVVDRSVIIKGKHEDKQDENNVVTRQFVRQFLLPDRADVNQVQSTISTDGILVVTVALKPAEEKVIQIEQTGQASVSSNSQTDASEAAGASGAAAGASGAAVEKNAENNEVEEVTATQAQEAGPKPEKR